MPFGKLPRKQREILLSGGKAGGRDEAEPVAPAKGTGARARAADAPAKGAVKSVEGGLRRHPAEPAAALRGGDLGRAGRARGVPIAAAVHGVPRQPAEAAEPGGPASRDDRSPTTSTCRFRKRSRCSTVSQLTDRESIIAERILREIQDRLRFLNNVGVGYLTLGRSAATLSGGEGQRIRLATQIGANLTGVLYVLDEPSIGLHQRDNRKLLSTLAHLRDLGNTVIVVEHDEETIRTADYVIDLGPGAGEHGGHVIFQGTPAQLLRETEARAAAAAAAMPSWPRHDDRSVSLTGAYLAGIRSIATPEGAPAGAEGRARHPRRAREQPQGHRRQHSAGRADRRHRRERLGQVDARQRHPLPVARQDAVQGGHRTGRARSDRGDRAARQGHRDRSVADRPDPAIQSGDLHRSLHVHPRSVRDDAGSQDPRLPAGPLLVQRQGRTLRSVSGRRRHRHRDALPARTCTSPASSARGGATTAKRSR